MYCRSYDPTDPIQRRMIDDLIPGLSKSKKEIVEEVLEQKHFLIACQLAASFSDVSGGSSYQCMFRLIKILGGVEPILRHEALDAANGVEQTSGFLKGLGTTWRGLFVSGYFDVRNGAAVIAGPYAKDRLERIVIAKSVLHLFPAFREGRIELADAYSGRNVQRISEGAAELVNMCEDVFKQASDPVQLVKDLGFGGPDVAAGNARSIGYSNRIAG